MQVAVEVPLLGSRGDRDGADRGGDPRKVSEKVAVPVGLTSPWVGEV